MVAVAGGEMTANVLGSVLLKYSSFFAYSTVQ